MTILRHIPNAISLLRILLVAPAIALLLQTRYFEALGVIFVAGVSDALDGWLAKRNGWHSALGAVLDPLADKLLLVSCFIALAYLELIPLWLAVLVLARDMVIVIGASAYRILVGRVTMSPSLSSKLNTVMQIALVLTIIVSQIASTIPASLATISIWLTAATGIWSGVSYIVVWSGYALRTPSHHEG